MQEGKWLFKWLAELYHECLFSSSNWNFQLQLWLNTNLARTQLLPETLLIAVLIWKLKLKPSGYLEAMWCLEQFQFHFLILPSLCSFICLPNLVAYYQFCPHPTLLNLFRLKLGLCSINNTGSVDSLIWFYALLLQR